MSAVSPTRLAVVLGGLIAVGPLAIDTYLPVLPAIADSFRVSVPEVELSLSLYLLGTAAGQLFGGPLSDHLGRRPVGTAGLALYLLCSLLIALSSQLWQLNLLRFIQALGGGATVVICAASVRDHFDGNEAARVLTTIGLVMLSAPLVAPALGTLLSNFFPWRSIFLFLALYAGLMLVVLRTRLPVMPAVRRSRTSVGEVVAAYARVLRHRRGMGFILANSLAFSAMFAFITDSAFVYIEHFGVDKNLFPVLFGSNVAFMILLNRLNMRLLRHFQPWQILRVALGVQLACAGALMLALLVGVLNLYVAVPLIMGVASIVALIIPNAIASFIHHFPEDSGAATAVNGTLQFCLAGLAGSLLSALHDQTLMPMASFILVCSLLAVIAAWWGRRGADTVVH